MFYQIQIPKVIFKYIIKISIAYYVYINTKSLLLTIVGYLLGNAIFPFILFKEIYSYIYESNYGVEL